MSTTKDKGSGTPDFVAEARSKYLAARADAKKRISETRKQPHSSKTPAGSTTYYAGPLPPVRVREGVLSHLHILDVALSAAIQKKIAEVIGKEISEFLDTPGEESEFKAFLDDLIARLRPELLKRLGDELKSPDERRPESDDAPERGK